MSDISFLLLAFFLMVSNINSDMGIARKLPPPLPEDAEAPEVKERNIFVVMVNKDDRLLFNTEYGRIEDLKDRNDRGTSYDMYLQVQNELTAAINEMRDELATARFGKHYADLSEPQRKAVETAIPMAISEAEPTKIGGK